MSRPLDERGFVLSLVIFAVAALSIAGTALFLIVQSENAMANAGAESITAFHAANAGLGRYMGESFGPVPSERVYEIGGGTVTVTATRVMAQGDTADLYLVQSRAAIPDRRVRELVSRRSVQQFALLRKRPFVTVASVVVAGTDVHTNNIVIEGRDQCRSGRDVAGIATLGGGNVRGTVNGNPPLYTASYETLMATLALDWTAMKDRSFEFDYEVPSEAWPRFTLLAANTYPTIRYTGNLSATSALSGRGLLVVTGDISLSDGFTWDGTILAGGLPRTTNATFTINGALLTGFEGADARIDLRGGTIRYDSCKVLSAAQGIAMLSPLMNTWWETVE